MRLCRLLPVLLFAVAGCQPAGRPRGPERDGRATSSAPTPMPTPSPAVTWTPERAMRLVPPDRWPALLDHGSRDTLSTAIAESLAWLATQPADRRFVFGPRAIVTAQLRAGLERFAALLVAEPTASGLAARVKEHFDLVESVGGADSAVLVTGYYVPEIAGSLVRDREHQVAIYSAPPDRLTLSAREFSDKAPDETWIGRLDGARVRPYWDRAAIRVGGALADRGLEIAWARDEVDLFFLEVQGSGVLRLPDGSRMGIGYDSANGRGYRSIGRLLADEGCIAREKMSMQSIREWLAANPDQLRRVLDANPSFVFFRKLKGSAEGYLGRPVTALRSIATDKRLFPPAALCWLETSFPEGGESGELIEGAPLEGFVLNQDTGSAIRGPDRVDLFWGTGDEAAERAGRMRNQGRLYLLVPKGG